MVVCQFKTTMWLSFFFKQQGIVFRVFGSIRKFWRFEVSLKEILPCNVLFTIGLHHPLKEMKPVGFPQKQGFSASARWFFVGVGSSPVHCRMFRSFPAHYPVDARKASLPPTVVTPKCFQISRNMLWGTKSLLVGNHCTNKLFQLSFYAAVWIERKCFIFSNNILKEYWVIDTGASSHRMSNHSKAHSIPDSPC